MVDASDPAFPAQVEVTREVLAEIGATGPAAARAQQGRPGRRRGTRAGWRGEWPDALLLSAREPADVAALRERLLAFFERDAVEAELVVPWAQQRVVAEAHASARVLEARSEADGTHLRLRARPEVLARLRSRLGPAS